MTLIRLRSGPFEGPATVKPPALPEDSYNTGPKQVHKRYQPVVQAPISNAPKKPRQKRLKRRYRRTQLPQRGFSSIRHRARSWPRLTCLRSLRLLQRSRPVREPHRGVQERLSRRPLELSPLSGQRLLPAPARRRVQPGQLLSSFVCSCPILGAPPRSKLSAPSSSKSALASATPPAVSVSTWPAVGRFRTCFAPPRSSSTAVDPPAAPNSAFHPQSSGAVPKNLPNPVPPSRHSFVLHDLWPAPSVIYPCS